MKKTGLLLLLSLVVAAQAQTASPAADQGTPQGTLPTNGNFPTERIETPTQSDVYCAGFINNQLLPNANFVAGGLDTPSTTQYAHGELVYLAGKGYELGKTYSVVRELRDPNRYEMFPGQFTMLKAMGQPYAELATAQVIDVRSRMAVARLDISCAPVLPGDLVIPFVEKPKISFRPPLHFDRFAPASGKPSGRIVLAKDFDAELGTGQKIYMNLGSNQGIKAGDYFRAFRNYEADLHDPVDSLSFKASTAEDTQAKPPSIEQGTLTRTNGPSIHVVDFPRRSVGEIVVLSTTPTTATGMIVFAMEDIHIGDGVELDPQ
jgi:hypothetical protein